MRPFQPVIQPAIPFVDRFESGLQPGCIITIEGFVPNNAYRFQVNFASGPIFDEKIRSPTAFHFNPRFNENEIYRNTYTPSTGWGHEEHSGIMTIVRNRPFQLMFLVEPNEFKIGINGQHFCGYAHRLPFQDINTLQIVGDVMIDKVLLHGDSAQTVGPPPVNFPVLPFEYPIRGWMGPGKVITIVGSPKSFPKQFHVDLYNETTGDILFHLNPRFNPDRYVVRNSCIGGNWGKEQIDTPFMHLMLDTRFNLMPDIRFNLKIACEPDFFSVFTNEQHFCYFGHRLPYNEATNIRIAGDVDIDSVTFT